MREHDSDRYTKKFTTKAPLISMLFCSFAKCNSLREVSGAILGLSGKTSDFQLKHIPKRSILSDANKNRTVEVFASIYNKLMHTYGSFLSDIRIKDLIDKQLKTVDSTTISLFKDLLKCVGSKSSTGKSKGGIKIHTVINADEIVPNLAWFSSAATNDPQFLKKFSCDANTIYVGYNDYKAFQNFSNHQTGFVTRIKDNASIEIIERNEIEEEIHCGVREDTIITVSVKAADGTASPLKLRKVRFYDRQNKREFEFIINLFEMRADRIATFYKLRWQIEIIFKQLKQNFPLNYFIGDNENAIKI